MRIDSSGNVLVTNAAKLGYGTGAGGTVTQSTSKSTSVTINKPCGQITMNNAAMLGGAVVVFDITNSLVTATDVVIANGTWPVNSYRVECFYVTAGAFSIRVTNITGGSLSDALVINFSVLAGATS
jgi:hypothetical protein